MKTIPVTATIKETSTRIILLFNAAKVNPCPDTHDAFGSKIWLK